MDELKHCNPDMRMGLQLVPVFLCLYSIYLVVMLPFRMILFHVSRYFFSREFVVFRSRSSCLEVFSGKGNLKMCSKFTREHSCRSLIPILNSNTALWHGWSPVNMLHIFRTPFLRNTSGRLLLNILTPCYKTHL